MSRSSLVIKFLNELNSNEMKSLMDHLASILESLESKDDPEPIEMSIVNEAYQTIEKIKVLESSLRTYVNEGGTLDGDKLNDLYESSNINGTSKLF